MPLIYLRLYVTYKFLFNLHQTNALKNIRMIECLVNGSLPNGIYERARRQKTAKKIKELF